jgi:hypothetical protein
VTIGRAGASVWRGQGFIDSGTDVHILRNEGTVQAETIAVQLLPKDAARKIDIMPAPGNCPFRAPNAGGRLPRRPPACAPVGESRGGIAPPTRPQKIEWHCLVTYTPLRYSCAQAVPGRTRPGYTVGAYAHMSQR